MRFTRSCSKQRSHRSPHLISAELNWTADRVQLCQLSPVHFNWDKMRWEEMRRCDVNITLTSFFLNDFQNCASSLHYWWESTATSQLQPGWNLQQTDIIWFHYNFGPGFIIPSIYGYKRIQKPVPLKYGKLATNLWIYGYFYSIQSKAACMSLSHLIWTRTEQGLSIVEDFQSQEADSVQCGSDEVDERF